MVKEALHSVVWTVNDFSSDNHMTVDCLALIAWKSTD